jgi:RNA polymerase sigma factor (sigma-70 family)
MMAMNMDSTPSAGQFATTRWSMILGAADHKSDIAPLAMQELCSAYWFPLYAFVRRQGWQPTDAEDLTQEFFARLLAKDGLSNVGPEKGRFRTFLLTCLKRFLTNEHDRRTAAKRGAGRKPISFNQADAEDRFALAASDATPEREFERRWALSVLERALQNLADEFATRGKEKLFNRMKVYLAADRAAPPYATMAEQMGVTEAAVKVAVHRLRARYRVLLEQEILSTLENPDELAQEIEHLMQALSK